MNDENELTRISGSITEWNSGWGYVLGQDNQKYSAHYTEFDDYKKKKSKIFLEVDDDVEFEPREVNGRLVAQNITHDTRSRLFKFAFIRDYESVIEKLALDENLLGGKERWSSSSFNESDEKKSIEDLAIKQKWLEKESNKKSSGLKPEDRVSKKKKNLLIRKKFLVLFSYIERTFQRVQLEGKILEFDEGAVFNTGLGNKFDRDIFAVFKLQPDKKGYYFDKFCDQTNILNKFKIDGELPEPANYFIDINTGQPVSSDHLIYDRSKRIFPKDEHILEHNKSRFPNDWIEIHGGDNANLREAFDSLLNQTRLRARRNYRTAVPFYFPSKKKVQMLLPITFFAGTERQSVRSLVVSREGSGYCVETIMPLDWAYKNARLLSRPDRDDWLDF